MKFKNVNSTSMAQVTSGSNHYVTAAGKDYRRDLGRPLERWRQRYPWLADPKEGADLLRRSR